MSPPSNTRREADAIVAHARSLARSRERADADPDAEVLASLAGATISLADIDDETLDRLRKRFGTDALVRAVMSAPDDTQAGNRNGEPSASSAAQASAPVIEMRPKRTALWSTRSTWMAAAASVALAAVTATLLFDNPTKDDVSPTTGGGQSGEFVPRVQTPGDQQAAKPPAPRAALSNRVAVLIRGNDSEAAARAESVLLRTLAGRPGLQALDSESLSLLRRSETAVQAASNGNFASLASVGRDRGVELLVIGDLTSQAIARNGTFSGVGELRTRTHLLSRQRSGDEQAFFTGSGATTSPSALTEGEARRQAAEDVANQAAIAVGRWLDDRQP